MIRFNILSYNTVLSFIIHRILIYTRIRTLTSDVSCWQFFHDWATEEKILFGWSNFPLCMLRNTLVKGSYVYIRSILIVWMNIRSIHIEWFMLISKIGIQLGKGSWGCKQSLTCGCHNGRQECLDLPSWRNVPRRTSGVRDWVRQSAVKCFTYIVCSALYSVCRAHSTYEY